jgi:phosphatidylinositol alpha-mannosyltransferase
LRRLMVATAVSPIAARAVRPFITARVVPNGLETSRYRMGEQKVRGRVVFVGRDDPRKGLDVLLQAWPLVLTAVPGSVLRVVGTARPSGPEGVVFLGRLEEEAKLRELARAELLCAPNLGGESFGLVVAEGMAAGCAVVASDLPAFRYVTGPSARLTAVGDATALAEALVALLADPVEAGRLAEAGRREVARFDRAAVLDGYLSAYRDALERG